VLETPPLVSRRKAAKTKSWAGAERAKKEIELSYENAALGRPVQQPSRAFAESNSPSCCRHSPVLSRDALYQFNGPLVGVDRTGHLVAIHRHLALIKGDCSAGLGEGLDREFVSLSRQSKEFLF
jgi:hypothetical protein